MIGSTTPSTMRVAAMDGSPAAPAGRRAPKETTHLTIAYPPSLCARLKALNPDDHFAEADLDASAPYLRSLPSPVRLSLQHLTEELDEQPVESMRAALLPTEPAFDAHIRTLVSDFYRRQRNVNLLVAASLATACVLTVAGLVAAANFTRPAAHPDQTARHHSTSIAWQPPAHHTRFLNARYTRNSTHSAELGSANPWSAPQVVLLQRGRPLALAPLLPRCQARYVLLRGLPDNATLSSGERTESGAWIVKDKDLPGLTLTLTDLPSGGNTDEASGDYPMDVYMLGPTDMPKSRQRLVLRVGTGAPAAATLAAHWPAALLDLALMSTSAEAKPLEPESSQLLARAARLLGEGDVAGARLLLLNLAEQGESEAAYELARSYDADALRALGVHGIPADPTRARGWYERASESGNQQAAERLKRFASLSG
jgi:TPR repeat protein